MIKANITEALSLNGFVPALIRRGIMKLAQDINFCLTMLIFHCFNSITKTFSITCCCTMDKTFLSR